MLDLTLVGLSAVCPLLLALWAAGRFVLERIK